MNKTIQIFFFLCFIISVLLNLFLSLQVRKYYLRFNKMRLDPLELHAIDLYENISSEKVVLLAIGDSRVAEWPAFTESTPYEFINHGVNGLTSSQLNLRKEFTPLFCIPDYTIIQIGINDLKAIPLDPGGKENIINSCIMNIQSVIKYYCGLGSRVIVCTIFPTGKVPFFRSLVWSGDVPQAITTINSFFLNQNSDSVFIFDTYSLLSDNSGKMKKEFKKDFLHINSAGYERLNEELIELLEEISD